MLAMLLDTIGFVALVIAVYVSIWFVIALILKRNDVADTAWGPGIAAASIAGAIRTHNHSFSAVFVTVLILTWGLRLSWHIGTRNSKKPEDYRYAAMRAAWGKWFYIRSYFEIFFFQGFLMLLVATPALLIDIYPGDIYSGGFSLLFMVVGALLWLFGFGFEALGDRQLRLFRSDTKNKGRVMTTGLWKYSRHPNYFGEITQWWAIGLMALPRPYGWIGLIGPIVITFLITRVSGVPLLEARYASNPDYQAYKRQTSSLFPLPPKIQPH